MSSLSVSTALIEETISRLQVGGRREEERAVLWLSRQSWREPVPVVQVYEPHQITAVDCFRLPPASMQALTAHLRSGRLRIAAQVHTHPGRAYHSKVDDEWAFVRHEGALSLVLPNFALETTTANFLQDVKTYRLSANNTWDLAANAGPQAALEITS